MTELIFRENAYERRCNATVVAAAADGIRLDRTVFYPMGGGQPGDTGVLRLADGSELAIVDTRKGETADEVCHIPAEGATLPEAGSTVIAEINWERRHRLMRMHTCMHVLCSLIEGDVTGGAVNDGKGRLDFNLPDTRLDKEKITEDLNAVIAGNNPVEARWIDDQELADNPQLVRTMSVKPPSGSGKVRVLEIVDVDLQPCGGTHVKSLGEIGRVVVAKIENKGRQNRRINLVLVD